MADLTEDQIRQQEEEEFEFRARAEEEDRARQQAAAASTASGPVNPAEPNLGEKLIGAAQVPFQLAAEHPVEAGLAVGGAKALHLAGKYVEGQRTAAQAANAVAQTNAASTAAENASKQFTSMLSNYSKMNNDIRQYQKAGQTVPQALLDAQARLGQQIEVAQSKLPGYDPNVKAPTAPVKPMAPAPAGPVAPQAMPQAPAADMYGRVEPTMGSVAPEAAKGAAPVAQAAEKPGMLKNLAQMAGKYGSALAESPLGKTLGGVARIAGSVPVMGAQLALYSGGLNQGEDQQMARIRAIQDSIGKMPKEQQSFYFTLPMNKKQQVDQMIMNGQDPSALLVPNAINSGYAQQLKTMGR
jgi:hypothetical protein